MAAKTLDPFRGFFMPDEPSPEFSDLIQASLAGNVGARGRLFEVLQEELKATADRLLLGQPKDQTLHASTLVQEAVAKLWKRPATSLPDDYRGLVRYAHRVMRNIIVDRARRKAAAARAGFGVRVSFDAVAVPAAEVGPDRLAVHEALEALELLAPRPAEVVSLRYFSGCTVNEIAEILGVSKSTVEADNRFALAWLREHLAGSRSP